MSSPITYSETIDGNFDPHFEVSVDLPRDVIRELEKVLGAEVTFGRVDFMLSDYFTSLAFKFPSDNPEGITPTSYVSVLVVTALRAEESWKKEPRWRIFISGARDVPEWLKKFSEYRDEKYLIQKLFAAIA